MVKQRRPSQDKREQNITGQDNNSRALLACTRQAFAVGAVVEKLLHLVGDSFLWTTALLTCILFSRCHPFRPLLQRPGNQSTAL